MIWCFLVEFMVELHGIKILYEDNHLLVIVKPANLPVCEDSSRDLDVLSILKLYLKEKYNKPGNVYLGLVHRLDRPVSGIMVFARTSKAALRLSEQVREKRMKKVYYAVIEGKLSKLPKKGVLEDYMYKDSKKNMSFVCSSEKQGAKKAILNYEVIEENSEVNLVRINLVTGRSHQIRVQFSSRGCPLVGDQKYNKNTKVGVNIALCACELGFYHPVSKEFVKFQIEIPDRYPFNLFDEKKSL